MLAGAAVLALLALIGLGWALAFLSGFRGFEVAALSVALGMATLVLAGTLLDIAGLRLSGTGGVLAGATAAGLGWAAAGWRIAARAGRRRSLSRGAEGE